MKIAVCVKQVRHIYARTGMDPSRHFIAEEDSVTIPNPLDERAVELALELKEAHGAAEVCLVTLGDPLAETSLRRCYAMGADRMVRIDPRGLNEIDGWVAAVALSAAMRRLSADLVLCGKESLDDRSGHVGVTVAELLGYPCVSGVIKLEVVAGSEEVVAHRAREKGDREVIRCRLPLLCTVERGSPEPRYPKLESLLKAQEEDTECWDASVLGLDPRSVEPLTRILRVYPPRPRVRKTKAPPSGLSAQARLQMLIGGGTIPGKEEVENIVELCPEEAARRIVAFLIEHKYL